MTSKHRLLACCKLSFDVAVPTPMILMLRPRSGPNQWVIREDFQLTPMIDVTEVTDSSGNLSQRLIAPVGQFEIYTSTEAMVTEQTQIAGNRSFVQIPDLPQDVLAYLLPSRYCESDRFGDMATEIAGDAQPGYAQVRAITDWVRQNVSNIPGSSTYPVSAIEVNDRREGVCRDLAQISIALCRALCIPVVGVGNRRRRRKTRRAAGCWCCRCACTRNPTRIQSCQRR